MEIYLKVQEHEIQLPVLPESYSFATSQNHQTVNVVKSGEFLLLGNKNLEELSFSSFLPYTKSSSAGYKTGAKFKEPLHILNTLKAWKSNNRIVRVIFTKTNINQEFVITAFSYAQQDGSGDFYYNLSFKAYQRQKVTVSVDGVTTLAAARDKQSTTSQTYTVQPKDTLKSIAKAKLGSSSKFTTLAKLNHIPAPYELKSGQVILLS